MLPETTEEQRAAALARAAEARRTRAEIKELLKTGSLSLEEVFARAEEDPLVAGTRAHAVILAMPGMGKIATKRLMEDIGIAENRTLKGLGPRQRAELLDRFA